MINRFGVLNLFIAIGLVAVTVTAIDCNSRPDFKNLKECCPHDDIFTKDITEKCKSLLNEGDAGPKSEGGGGPRGPGGHGKHPHFHSCYDECVLNGTGIIDLAKMEVDESKAKTYFTSVLSATPDFVQVFIDASVKCAEKGKEMRTKFEKDTSPRPSPPPGASACKPCASMFRHCVKKEMTINCPTSAWLNDEKCNNAREFMMVCKGPEGGPRGPPSS